LTELVRAQGVALRCVVAAGGDGTFNEVINRAPGVPVSILPLGNENLVAKQFNLGNSAEKLAQAILAGSIRQLDLARARGRYFSLMAGAGIDAEVVHRVHHSRRSHISKRTYALQALWALGSFAYPTIGVENLETGERLQGSTAFVFNLPRYGLNLPIASRARPDDGHLDLWVFERPGLRNLVRYFIAVLRNRHHAMPDVKHRLVKQVRLVAEGHVPLQVDGDPAGALPVEIEVAPGEMQLVIE
jgi:diacylglycerol kinase family enzyme